MAEKAGNLKLAATAGIEGVVGVAGVAESGSDIVAAGLAGGGRRGVEFPGSPM